MSLTGTYINSLSRTAPADTASAGLIDNHLRFTKSVTLATCPNLNAAINATQDELNYTIGLTENLQDTINNLISATSTITVGTVTVNPSATGTVDLMTHSLGYFYIWSVYRISNSPNTPILRGTETSATNSDTSVFCWVQGNYSSSLDKLVVKNTTLNTATVSYAVKGWT